MAAVIPHAAGPDTAKRDAVPANLQDRLVDSDTAGHDAGDIILGADFVSAILTVLATWMLLTTAKRLNSGFSLQREYRGMEFASALTSRIRRMEAPMDRRPHRTAPHAAMGVRSCFLSAMAAMGALLVPIASAGAPANNLLQLGLGLHNDGNDLTQLGLGLHNVSWFGDGSVRTVVGDGSVRTISVGTDAHASLCFHGVGVTGNILDGTSNTIVFSESVGLRFSGGSFTPLTPDVRSILDGTSNTIFLGEIPTDFCFGNVGNLDPVSPPGITDGTSNTILIGERSNFDLCLSRATLPAITDGTSNTIILGESRTNACFYDIVPAADITVTSTVPEPIPLALIVPSLVALAGARRRRSR